MSMEDLMERLILLFANSYPIPRVYVRNLLPTIPRHGLLGSSYFCINIVYYFRGTEQFHL